MALWTNDHDPIDLVKFKNKLLRVKEKDNNRELDNKQAYEILSQWNRWIMGFLKEPYNTNCLGINDGIEPDVLRVLTIIQKSGEKKVIKITSYNLEVFLISYNGQFYWSHVIDSLIRRIDQSLKDPEIQRKLQNRRDTPTVCWNGNKCKAHPCYYYHGSCPKCEADKGCKFGEKCQKKGESEHNKLFCHCN